MKTLMVFDFDHTVVDDNSDTWVIRCLPDQTLPNSLKDSYQKGQWTDYMGRVLSYIGDQAVSPDGIRVTMETIPFTEGMAELLVFISAHKSTVDCVVISDSNAVFIDWILGAAGLRSAVDRVLTNPARFDDRGYLRVRRHHSHDCACCPVNLCKRKALEQYLAERSASGDTEYHRMFYVGDGGNDLCPTSCLRGGDVVMPRRGFTLEGLLSKLQGREPSLKARVVPWSSGTEVLAELRAHMLQSRP
ncbi:hypothetical protein NHX12_006261 [Muraenolepis orangiensis]|uniref:Phosphatase phospho2 n=1 Tax=Muraenolepis orangiensis TaxID=630683 RepID=A0A9Q0DUR3_9TELE|nr:hypothetical protein NHX12_006261 [Muraenolepis orangiensis]